MHSKLFLWILAYFCFSFHKLCFSCSFLLILNNEKISKKFWAMAAHQKLNSLISVFLITLINPLKKNNLGAKVSVTQDWRLHHPSAVPGRRERKFIAQHTVGGHIFWPFRSKSTLLLAFLDVFAQIKNKQKIQEESQKIGEQFASLNFSNYPH